MKKCFSRPVKPIEPGTRVAVVSAPMSRSKRREALMLGTLSGALLGVASLPGPLGVLGFVALVPLLIAVDRGATVFTASLAGFLAGLLQFGIGFGFIPFAAVGGGPALLAVYLLGNPAAGGRHGRLRRRPGVDATLLASLSPARRTRWLDRPGVAAFPELDRNSLEPPGVRAGGTPGPDPGREPGWPLRHLVLGRLGECGPGRVPFARASTHRHPGNRPRHAAGSGTAAVSRGSGLVAPGGGRSTRPLRATAAPCGVVPPEPPPPARSDRRGDRRAAGSPRLAGVRLRARPRAWRRRLPLGHRERIRDLFRHRRLANSRIRARRSDATPR